jgi:hypothetical protein
LAVSNVRVAALSFLLAFAAFDPAHPCGRNTKNDTMVLDETWRERFREQFQSLHAAYVVKVRSIGPLDKLASRMPCDEEPMPPPPPARGARKRNRLDYEDALRAMEAAEVRCQPEAAVEVTVTEVVKGPLRPTWVEQVAYIDVVDEPPLEPRIFGGVQEYGSVVGNRWAVMCGVYVARRMSASSEYLLFVGNRGGQGNAPSTYISRAYLVDGKAPFLAEARRLAAEGASLPPTLSGR